METTFIDDARRSRPARARTGAAGAIAGLVIAALLAGCAAPDRSRGPGRHATPEPPRLDYERFGERAQIPEFEALLALSEAQREAFLRDFRSGGHRDRRPHHRLYEYLVRQLSDFRFTGRTHDARHALEKSTGNCMSLALLTTALARVAGLDVSWQLARTDPVYSSEGSVIYSADHIQTKVYDVDEPSSSLDILTPRPYLLIDYFADTPRTGGVVLNDAQLHALVYQNLGVEALTEGRLDRAFWLLVEALGYDPNNPGLYNALGVIHRRAGSIATAEALFRHSIVRFGDDLLVLRNYRQLLLAAGREAEAAALERRIAQLPDPDPFPLLESGDAALARQQPDRALDYYRQAREIAPYLDQVHLRIADALLAAGKRPLALRALRQARDLAWTDSDRNRYQAKLDALLNLTP